ncbi:MAG: Ig-like domain repeat protein, partial [Bryocella sp.]
IAWATPASITFGTALSASQLNATASYNATAVPGIFTYTPALSTVLAAGTQTLSVSFTPTDATDYNTVTATVSLTVTKVVPVIAWPTPASITYGTALSATQLNATASYNATAVPGSFTYTPALSAVPAAGTQTLSVSFTPTDAANYNTVTATVSLIVAKATLNLTANSAPRLYGVANAAFTGSQSGSVNGDTFTESFTTTATQSSNVGTYAIVPSATGTNLSNYTVTATNGTLTITQAADTAGLSASNSSLAAGQTLSLTTQVSSSAAGTPTGTVSFYDGATLLGTVTLISGSATYTTTSLAPGSHTLTSKYSGDVNFAASTVSSSVQVLVVTALDFTLTLQNSSATSVMPGRAETYSLQIAPIYTNYPAAVTFSASGLPHGATASFSPANVAATGGPTPVTMTVQTASPTLAENLMKHGAPLTLAFLLIPLLGLRKARRKWMPLLVALIALTSFAVLSGCGTANGFNGQAVQNFAITVTATSGTVQHSLQVNLNLQ